MEMILPGNQSSTRHCMHPSQCLEHVEPISDPLHVIAVVSNPGRYRTRYALYRAFAKHVEDSGAILHTVELALRDRHFEITTPGANTVQLRSPDQLWHKENLINIGIRALPADWKYVAWVDADVVFARPDWVYETLHRLQEYSFVQMFSHAIDLGPSYEPLQQFNGFMFSYQNGAQFPRIVNSQRGRYMAGGHQWHPGYAWAARRSALSDVGLLGDVGILGSGDHHMACAMIGRVDESIHNGMDESYKRYWRLWQQRCLDSSKKNVGYVPGTIFHNWHGKKANRKYVDRWEILTTHNFNWQEDVMRDAQGLWQLTGNKPGLRDDIRAYFSQRNEDSPEL